MKIIFKSKVHLVLLKCSHWVRFNEVYFIIFIFKMWRILNFEWILLKIQTNYKKLCLKGKMSWVCSPLGLTTHVTLFICEGLDSLFCFVIMISPKAWCFTLCYGIYHKKISMSKVTSTWFLKCLELWCGIYWLLNHFFIELKKT
jgi:hypothetical protein